MVDVVGETAKDQALPLQQQVTTVDFVAIIIINDYYSHRLLQQQHRPTVLKCFPFFSLHFRFSFVSDN